MSLRRAFSALCLIACLVLPVWAYEGGMPLGPVLLNGTAHTWGATGWLGLQLPAGFWGGSSRFWASVHSIWDTRRLFHSPQSFSLDDTSRYPEAAARLYSNLRSGWSLGWFALAAPGSRFGNAELFLLYRGSWVWHPRPAFNLVIYDTAFPDRESAVFHSLTGGARINRVQVDRHMLRSGFYAESSWETAPEWLINQTASGPVDYGRLNIILRGYLPLFDSAPASQHNELSAYASAQLLADWLYGGHIPLLARTTIGGLYPRYGLGDLVRAVDTSRYDAELRVALNLDVRLNLPTLFDGFLKPGVLALVDGGYYQFAQNTTSTDGGSGLVSGAGCGLFIEADIFGLKIAGQAATLWRLDAENANGSRWVPLLLGLSFHF